MGLAASQARFLGITLRKANCEFKSTALAQERLELTEQMTQISNDYFNAINATKLVWSNPLCETDMGVSFALLMTPSAANDFNPYMITTKRGAVVLNSGYADAARAAGIPMGGCIASEEGYQTFIQVLGGSIPGKDADGNPTNVKVITTETMDTLLNLGGTNKVDYHYASGRGAYPMDKSVMGNATLDDLLLDDSIGGKKIDWLQIYRNALGFSYNDVQTELQKSQQKTVDYSAIVSELKSNYIKSGSNAAENTNRAAHLLTIETTTANWSLDPSSGVTNIFQQFAQLETKANAGDSAAKNELENLKIGKDKNGDYLTSIKGLGDNETLYDKPKLCELLWYMYLQKKDAAKVNIEWDKTTHSGGEYGENGKYDSATTTYTIGLDALFHTHGNRDIAGGNEPGVYVVDQTGMTDSQKRKDFPTENNKLSTLTMVTNGSIEMSASTIKEMTLADILTQDIVIMTQVHSASNQNQGATRDTTDLNKDTAAKSIQIAGEAILEDIARIFGYNTSGVGLNIAGDATTNEALNKAYEMTKKKFLSLGDAAKCYSGDDDQNMKNNGAYNMAHEYNRIGIMQDDNETYAALNISSMVSTFLTYYDNYLRGNQSEYYVNKSNDEDRTFFVTDDPSYIYVTTGTSSVTNDDKINDFFNQLYNNLCEHGWRYDDHVEDYEYLESAIKDGRYSLMALNPDGFFYQAKYNAVDYIVEETDRDSIARAEADFTRKKAELTNKEDRLDIKTKKLDAEIAELTTELNSVQQIISKSIEKTFSLFSN